MNTTDNTLSFATVYKRHPHIIVIVQPTGKIRETKSELLGSIKDLVSLKADQRLKPENQVADLQKKIDGFIENIADKYQLVDQQLACQVIDYRDPLAKPVAEFTCFASDFNTKLPIALNKLGACELAKDEIAPVLLLGPYVSDSYRGIMRQIIVAGTVPAHPLDYCDVLSTLIPSVAWEQLTEPARKQCYYGSLTPAQFYVQAFRAIYEFTEEDAAVMAKYNDRVAGA
jgi:hypothetical protein